MYKNPLTYIKAIIGAGVAFGGSVVAGYTDGTMSTAEWWTAAVAALIALGGVFGVGNKSTRRRTAR